MLDRLPDEILVNILTRLEPLEDVLEALPCVCRSWSHMLDSTSKRDHFWALLATSRGISVGRRSGSRNNGKKVVMRRYRELRKARQNDVDKMIHMLARRLEKNDCAAFVRKKIIATTTTSTTNSSFPATATISSNNNIAIVHRAVPSMEHRTLLHVACWRGRLQTVNMLLNEFDASIFVQDDSNATPLLVAAWAGHAAVVQVILTHLKEQHGQQQNGKQNNTVLDYIHQKGIPPQTSSCGGRGPKTALVWAYRKKFCAVVKPLMQAAQIQDGVAYMRDQNEFD